MVKVYAVLCILVAFVLGETFACPRECTCPETKIACTNLTALPDASDLSAYRDTVETVSITDSPSVIEIPDYFFSRMPELTTVNLSSNQLSTFKMDSLEYAKSLRTIDLTNNPIVCDNNIDWLQKWKTYLPGNNVTGTCIGSGEDINRYLSDKPENLVSIRFANKRVVLDRTCTMVTLPFVVIGKFTSDLEYRALIQDSPRSAVISVVNETITVPVVGTKNSTVTIDVNNRGEDRNNLEFLVHLYPKYPVSYETQVEVHLRSGSGSRCVAPVPVVMAATTTSVKPTMTDTVSTEPTPTSKTEPTPTSKTTPTPTSKTEPTPTSKTTPTPSPPFPGWLIILIAVLIIAAIVVISLAVWHFCCTREGTV